MASVDAKWAGQSNNAARNVMKPAGSRPLLNFYIAVATWSHPGTLGKEAAVRTEAITVMIDFFESKTFNAAAVGALTTAVSHNSAMSTWAAIGLALLVVGTFLLIFRKAHIKLPMHPTAEAPLADDGQSRILSRLRSCLCLKASDGEPVGGRRQTIAPPFLIEAPSGAFGAGDYRGIGRIITPAAVRIGYMTISHAYGAGQWLPKGVSSIKSRCVAHSTL